MFFIVTWASSTFFSFCGTVRMLSILGILCVPATYCQKPRSRFSESLKVFLIKGTSPTGDMLCPTTPKMPSIFLFIMIWTQKSPLLSATLNFWTLSSLPVSRLLHPCWLCSLLSKYPHLQLPMIWMKIQSLSDIWALLRAHTMSQYLAWKTHTTLLFPWGEMSRIHVGHLSTQIHSIAL